MKKIKKNIKFILAILGLMVLGFIAGLVSSNYSLGKLMYQGLTSLENIINYNIYPIFFIFVIGIDLLILIFFLIGKKE